MCLLTIQLDLLEVAVFSFSFLLLAGTIYFFRKTIIGLRSIKEQQKRMANRMVSTYSDKEEVKKEPKKRINTLKKRINTLFKKRRTSSRTVTQEVDFNAPVKRNSSSTETLHSVEESILLQKRQLDRLLQRVDSFKDEPATTVVKSDATELHNKIDRLELLLEEKEEELQKWAQKNEVTEIMASRLEQVQREFDALQTRLTGLEKQAGAANQLAMDLEDVKEEYRQLQKEQQRKGEKLHQLVSENARLHQQLAETEDKLQEANTQRQQFMKRARLLEELNTDFQYVSDTNSKMKNELRRIGELESMLNMMTEERDHLLRKRAC